MDIISKITDSLNIKEMAALNKKTFLVGLLRYFLIGTPLIVLLWIYGLGKKLLGI